MEKVRRLSDFTHKLNKTALSGKRGKGLTDLEITLDGNCPQNISEELEYAYCIKLIAENAPIRILPGEKIIGSATLKQSAYHKIPVMKDGKIRFPSVSHLTLGFDFALKMGYNGLLKDIEERKLKNDLDEKGSNLLNAMKMCIEVANTWHQRHVEALQELIKNSRAVEKCNYEAVLKNIEHIPEKPPSSFYEAAQSLYFMFSFQRLCGNWSGIGRIDEMLGGFLKKDLKEGKVSLSEAREILAHFWIKGCDWLGFEGSQGGSGDAMFYQNIILGGINAEGKDITNEVTYLILDVVEELNINEFPIAVRLSSKSPEKLIRRVAEVQSLGGGILAVYNEETVIKALVKFGYPLKIARSFANDGCWEILIPGKTAFIYFPIDVFLILQKTLGVAEKTTAKKYGSFEKLYGAYKKNLSIAIDSFNRIADKDFASGKPATLISLLIKDCIRKGRGYNERGARYTVFSPHAGGLQDAGNSLHVIKSLVYDKKTVKLSGLVRALKNNWEGEEQLRQHILNSMELYGNDSKPADTMVKRVLDDFLQLTGKVKERKGVLRPPGISTFGREIEWREKRKASAHGYRQETPLAINFSPTPGSDKNSITAVIKSYCFMDLKRLPNGTALDLKLHPTSVKGKNGVAALEGVLKAFVKLKGFFMHINVIDNKTLLDAQKHPEKYRGLSVRISGWSARFVTLNKEWQQMIINRTLHK